MTAAELNSPIIDEARTKLSAGLRFLEKIDRAADEHRKLLATNQTRIEEIRREFPGEIVGLVLGEVSDKKIDDLKHELKWRTEAVELDLPAILEGLAARRRREFSLVNQVKVGILDKLDRYVNYRREALEGSAGSLSFAEDLAKPLGLEEDLAEVRRQIQK